MAYCVLCDMSQFTTPLPTHPGPLSGAQIRSIPATREEAQTHLRDALMEADDKDDEDDEGDQGDNKGEGGEKRGE